MLQSPSAKVREEFSQEPSDLAGVCLTWTAPRQPPKIGKSISATGNSASAV
jgi:hypothetical protein